MINGHTKQLGIIGYPVEHSFSPKMHNFLSEITHSNFTYSAWPVETKNLEAAIDGVRALNIAGINVTAPHKTEVMKYLDEISEQAKLLGSVNTVVNRGGRLIGYNTDAEGFLAALKSAGIDVTGKRVLVIGAGGVVKPTLIRLIQEKPLSVTVANRTKSKVMALAEAINDKTGFGICTDIRDKSFDVVINTTSAGMEPQLDALPTDAIAELGDLSFINGNTAVVDMIYNPEETLFLKKARERGAVKVINGLGMLIYQGILAYELFTGVKLDGDIAETVKREVFNR